jgi:hypothetical protein|tara:strand:- start:618 stop:926 length:309 start_codon:yes stop_codon:yes gene_type:complete
MISFYILLLTSFVTFDFLFSDDGDIPTNLQIDAASIGGVQLSWDTPENYKREWLSHSNLAYYGGIVNWDGKSNSGQNVSGGIYLYTLESSTFSKTKKMILLK